jgi:peptidoglycan/xylan/chitin deacetylase (PgdA/CDA1 family)
LEVATPALIEHGMTADFFVNPTTVGEPGFISWAGLRDMAEQGMSIQSHGYSHCYFDELPAADIREQLARSKSEIEDHVGVEVTLFAPPGGRLNLQVTAIARELGYAGICSSRPGTWSGNDFHVPRMAILSSTSSARFVKWVTGAPLEMLRSTGRYEITRTLKKTLGNTVYDRVRGYLVGKSG